MTTSQPGHPPADPSGRERARQAGRIVGSGAKVAGRGFAGAARVTGRLGRATLRQARRGAEAEGAGQSGLSRLIEMLERGEFDLVAVGRALIVDPDWPKKIRAGLESDLIPYDPSALSKLL